MTDGALLSCTVYSNAPIFCVPTGVIRFWLANALATSCPDSPRACIASESISIRICRVLPP